MVSLCSCTRIGAQETKLDDTWTEVTTKGVKGAIQGTHDRSHDAVTGRNKRLECRIKKRSLRPQSVSMNVVTGRTIGDKVDIIVIKTEVTENLTPDLRGGNEKTSSTSIKNVIRVTIGERRQMCYQKGGRQLVPANGLRVDVVESLLESPSKRHRLADVDQIPVNHMAQVDRRR